MNTVAIPLYNLLWVDVGDASITIKFAEKASKSKVRANSLTYPYELPARSAVEAWTAKLLNTAYRSAWGPVVVEVRRQLTTRDSLDTTATIQSPHKSLRRPGKRRTAVRDGV